MIDHNFNNGWPPKQNTITIPCIVVYMKDNLDTIQYSLRSSSLPIYREDKYLRK